MFLSGTGDGVDVAEFCVGVVVDIGCGCNESDIEKFKTCVRLRTIMNNYMKAPVNIDYHLFVYDGASAFHVFFFFILKFVAVVVMVMAVFEGKIIT